MNRMRTTYVLILAIMVLIGPPMGVRSTAQNDPGGAPAKQTVAEQAAGESGEAVKNDSLWELIKKGGNMMFLIGLCSILAVGVGLERLFSLRRSQVVPEGFTEELTNRLRQKEKPIERGKEYCDQHSSTVSEIFHAGLSELKRGEEAMEQALEETGARVIGRMKRSLRPLSSIAQIAPLLGLLGTIFGLIVAFQSTASAGVNKGDQLAHGIYTALVTTAAGLTLAVPVLMVYHYLDSRVEALFDRIDEKAGELVNTVHETAIADEE